DRHQRRARSVPPPYAPRQQHEAEEVAREQPPGARVLPQKRGEVLQEERLDPLLAPETARRAAMLVMDAAPRREQRRPAALPGAVAEVDVLDVDGREDRVVEPAEREEARAVVRRGAAAGEEDGVGIVLVEAIEVEETHEPAMQHRVHLAGLPARPVGIHEVDLARDAEDLWVLAEDVEQRLHEV